MRWRWFVWIAGLLSLVACAVWPAAETDSSSLPPPRLLTPTPVPIAPATSTAQRILTRGRLWVGVRYDLEPWAFINEKGDLVGLDVDLARELARRWLGDPQAVEFVQVRSDSAQRMLQSRQIDLAFAGLDWTRAAEQEVDFGPPYAVNGLALLTYPDSGILGPQDVVSRTLTCLTWTGTCAQLAAYYPPTVTLLPADHFATAVSFLAARQVEAYADQRFRLERARRILTGTRIVAPVTQAWWAPMFQEADPFFADLVTLTLEDLWQDGTLSALYARWLPDAPPPDLKLHSGKAPLPALTQAPLALSSRNTLAQLRATQALTVAYLPDHWPYSGLSRGQLSGFEVRLVQAMAGLWFGSPETVTFIPMDVEVARAALQTGEVQMAIGGWELSREAEMALDFALPHYDDGGSWLAPASAPVASLADLGERAFGVLAGSEEESLTANWSPAPPKVAYADLDAALEGLARGEIAAIFAARRPLLAIAYTGSGYVVSDERWNARPIALALPPGDSDFRDWVNFTLYALAESGDYGELFKVWFDDPQPFWPPWPGPAPVAWVLK